MRYDIILTLLSVFILIAMVQRYKGSTALIQATVDAWEAIKVWALDKDRIMPLFLLLIIVTFVNYIANGG